jgi:hypothetical protein
MELSGDDAQGVKKDEDGTCGGGWGLVFVLVGVRPCLYPILFCIPSRGATVKVPTLLHILSRPYNDNTSGSRSAFMIRAVE